MSTRDGGAARWWGSLVHLAGEWPSIALSAVLASLSAASEAAGLVLVITLANALTQGSDAAIEPEIGPISISFSFEEAIVAAVGFIVLSAAGRIGSGLVVARRRADLMSRWRTQIVTGFLQSRYEFESRLRAGDVIEASGNHAKEAAGILGTVASMLNSVFSMVILVGVAFTLDPLAASILIAGGSLLLLALRPASKRTKRLAAQEANLDVEFGNEVDEIVSVARDIKLFGAADAFSQNLAELADKTAHTQMRVILLGRSVPVLFQATGLLLLLGVLGIAATLDSVDVAALAGAAILLYRGLAYGQQLSGFQQHLSRQGPYVLRLQEALTAFSASSDDFGELPIESVKSVELENVSYEYEGDGPPAIEDVDLVIKQTGIVGFVGPSGSGKSTLAQILLRLRTPTTGRFLVNGTDSMEFDVESWRSSVAFVPQEAALIHATLFENIAYFRDWVSRSAVEEAAEAAGLGSLIHSLPQGLATPIGPSVREVSGGQRQRIGIARALAGNPSLVVLDEPTSALDSETEEWIMRALGLLRNSTMVVVITHRESTMEHCDTLVHFAAGRVYSETDPPKPPL